MKTLLCLLALAAASMSAVILPEQGSRTKLLGNIHQGLTPIGEVDGKMYYVDFQYMPWQDTLSHCHSLGENMDVASITTRTQMDFLVQAFNEAGYSEDFWVSGRDARGPRQYTWDHTGEAVTPDIKFAASPWYQTCLVIRPSPNNATKLHGVHCETNRLATMCELYL